MNVSLLSICSNGHSEGTVPTASYPPKHSNALTHSFLSEHQRARRSWQLRFLKSLGLQNKECLACKEMHCPALWLHSYSPQLLGFRLGSLKQATPVLWRKSLALLVHHQGVVLTMKLGKSQSSHRKNRCED